MWFNFLLSNKTNIYLDYAASTPVSSTVYKAMQPYWSQLFFNPEAPYTRAQAIKNTISEAERNVRRYSSMTNQDYLLWTSGGSESNKLAIDHAIERWKAINPNENYYVVLSSVEHSSVHDYLKDYQDELMHVVYMPVNSKGITLVEALDTLDVDWSRVALVSCLLQSSEVGTTQPIKKLVNKIYSLTTDNQVHFPFIHVDASQGLFYHKLNITDWGVDTVTLCAQKINGPKGAGALICTPNVTIERRGTLATPLIIGLTEAIGQAQENIDTNCSLIVQKREIFFDCLDTQGVSYVRHGRRQEKSLIINISFPDVSFDSERLIIACDQQGVELSSKSACVGSQQEDSRVLEAMGEKVGNSLRISLHHDMKNREIKEAALRISHALYSLNK